jgi:hypothetical protein
MLNYIEELTGLNLPSGQYAIFGSGPLAIRNLRDAGDIDIIVTQELWEKLAKTHPQTVKETIKGPVTSINIGHLEIYRDWLNLTPKIKELIETADIINNLPFVKLEYVIEWKTYMGRDKDKNDLKLIKTHLNSKT